MAKQTPVGQRPALFSRRQFAAALPAALVASSAFPQVADIKLLRLNSFELRVPDPAASVDFYQGLFGMPVQSRHGGRICLRVGDGPQFMAIREATMGAAPRITQIGYAVDGFKIERALTALEEIGFRRTEPPPLEDDGIAHAMTTWVRRRGEAEELHFVDERGLIVQLSHPDYCGGAGELGNRCGRPEPAPDGLIRLADLNHFTCFVNGGAEANRFYQETFGLGVQAYQGQQSPVTGIGDGRQFVMYAGGRRDEPTPANIHHGSFNIHDFDLETVRRKLSGYGLEARDGAGADPLIHYVSLRMPERGGAEGGTPELYFTDPDGILLQLQHFDYCGGGGYLGSECL